MKRTGGESALSDADSPLPFHGSNIVRTTPAVRVIFGSSIEDGFRDQRVSPVSQANLISSPLAPFKRMLRASPIDLGPSTRRHCGLR